jgi:DNA-binding CsgD family transcriptional regulator
MSVSVSVPGLRHSRTSPGAKEYLRHYEADHEADGDEGRLVMTGPEEATWTSWERHPAGDEVVVALSGHQTLIQEVDGSPRTATARTRGAPPRHNTATTSAYGWSSLTDTEVAVAEQVAQGLTNREAAAHLYLSPHTIDYHLRQVFQKLDVRSRVELIRAILRRQAELPR